MSQLSITATFPTTPPIVSPEGTQEGKEEYQSFSCSQTAGSPKVHLRKQHEKAEETDPRYLRYISKE